MAVVKKRYQVIKPKHGFYKGECLDTDIAPTIDTGVGCWHTLIGESMEEIKCEQVSILSGGKWDKLLAYDEQNGYIRQDGCVGTLTTDDSSPKHNNRIIEPRIAAMRGRNPDNPSDRTADSPTEQRLEIGSEETSNTLTTVQKDNLVVEPNYRFFEQAFETLKENHCEVGDTIDAFNKRVNKDGISPTITTRPDGFKTAILPVAQDYRIRKLTERECFRLMGVKEEDFERVAKNQSTSALYHEAGDSIVTTCLMAIFGELFDCNYQEKINSLVEELRK